MFTQGASFKKTNCLQTTATDFADERSFIGLSQAAGFGFFWTTEFIDLERISGNKQMKSVVF
jgi:hypothetical protein